MVPGLERSAGDKWCLTYRRAGETMCGSGFGRYEHESWFLRLYLHAAAHNLEGDVVCLTQHRYVVMSHYQSSAYPLQGRIFNRNSWSPPLFRRS